MLTTETTSRDSQNPQLRASNLLTEPRKCVDEAGGSDSATSTVSTCIGDARCATGTMDEVPNLLRRPVPHIGKRFGAIKVAHSNSARDEPKRQECGLGETCGNRRCPANMTGQKRQPEGVLSNHGCHTQHEVLKNSRTTIVKNLDLSSQRETGSCCNPTERHASVQHVLLGCDSVRHPAARPTGLLKTNKNIGTTLLFPHARN